jgi:6-phosphogluconolactonase
MEFVEESNNNILAKKASEAILERAKEISEKKGNVVLALPGGRSIAGILNEFRQSEDDIWRRIHIFMVDERLVDIDDAESNYKLIMDSFANELIDKGLLSEDNLHPFIIDNDSDDFGAARYYNELEKHGGGYDIVLLSSGEDGHVAGLYPNNSALSIPGKKFITLHDSPKPPKDRMTSSIELISSSGMAVLLFIGEGKKEALEAFNNPKQGILDCPAKMVLWMKDARVYTDLED